MSDFNRFITALGSPDETAREAAWAALRTLDEDAMDPLTDAFYAGVPEATGVCILNLVAEIGGPDALLLLRSVYDSSERPAWKRAAASGLLRNADNLEAVERDMLRRFLEA
jgi:hypothetical protein